MVLSSWAIPQLRIYWTISMKAKNTYILQNMFFWDVKKVPNLSTRWHPGSIGDHIRTLPFPYMVWVIWTIYFYKFHAIYEVDILFRHSMGSLEVFDMKSTSNKHKRHADRTWACHKWRIISLYLKFWIHFFSKIRMDAIFFQLLAWKKPWGFY